MLSRFLSFLSFHLTWCWSIPLKFILFYFQPVKGDERYLQFCEACEGFKAPRAHHCRKCESPVGPYVRKMHFHFLIINDFLLETNLMKMIHWPWTLKEVFLSCPPSSQQNWPTASLVPTSFEVLPLQGTNMLPLGLPLFMYKRCYGNKKLHQLTERNMYSHPLSKFSLL